jgi:hypothetical protein
MFQTQTSGTLHSYEAAEKKKSTGTYLADLQDEHKVFPRLQTFITRKRRGIETFFLPLLKLVSTILRHVFIVVTLCTNLKARITDAFATITEDIFDVRVTVHRRYYVR